MESETMSDFIPVNEPLLDGNEKKYLQECIETGWISSEGHFVKEFEHKFAKRVGRRHGIAVCNGTAALDVAVEALGIGPGDEVILPSFTIISCIQQIVRSGARAKVPHLGQYSSLIERRAFLPQIYNEGLTINPTIMKKACNPIVISITTVLPGKRVCEAPTP